MTQTPRRARRARRPALGAAVAALLALLLLLSGPWAHAAQSDPGGLASSAVRDRVLREGSARVLVELRLPLAHTPEGLLTDAGAALQQGDIAAIGSQVLARLAGRLARLLHRYETVPFLALEIGADALAELEASSPWVTRVVEDELHEPTLAQSGPLVGADQAWTRGFDGTGRVVAILDTGVQSSHPFLAGKVVEEACFSSNVTGRSTSLCPNGQSQQIGAGAATPCTLSGCWHGTHVAGIAAGNGAAAGVSFSGVARGAQIMAVQVFSRFTQTTDCGGTAPCILAWTSDMMAGLEHVYARRTALNLAAANMSLGGSTSTTPCDSNPQKPIVDNLRSAGIATVIAAGNDSSTNAISSPACISTAISVGATTKSDVVASYSNVAWFLSMFAPGSSINSSMTGGGFGTASGTSMATPHVTGAWAVLKQAVPSASVTQILSALQSTGLPVTDTRVGGSVTKPRIRVANALALLAPNPTLSVSPASVAAGGSVTATWTNIASPTGADWIGLYAPGAADTAYLARIYVGCGSSPAAAGVAAGSCPFAVPGSVAPGTYELRLFGNNTFTRLATSGPLTVTTAAATLSASPTSVAAGTSVTVTWSGIVGPTAADWIGLYVPGAANTAYLSRIYVGCGASPGATGVAAGSCSFPLATSLTPGTYELRLFSNNSLTLLGTSNTFSVTAASLTTLSASPGTVAVPGEVSAAWSGIPAPTESDWIGLYVPGSADSSYLAWIYVSCYQFATTPRKSGSCPFALSGSVTPGTYELRLYSNNGYTRLATSNTFTVISPTPPTLAASPGSAPAGGSVTAAWSNIAAPSPADWIGLYVPGAANSSYLARIYVGCGASPSGSGIAAGSCPFNLPSTLTARTYELRLFSNNTFTRLATSNAFTVTAVVPATLTASPASVVAGGTATATWSGIASPMPADWIGLYVPGSANTAYLTRIYVGCGTSPGPSGIAAGSCPFALASTLTPRTYELRLFSNNTFTRLATSNTFTVTSGAGPTITASPSSVAVGGSVTATWSGIATPTPTDWIGLYAPGSANQTYLAWVYVSCSQTAGTAQASGSCALGVPASLAAGSYELRLYSNNGYTRLATSSAFTVTQ